MTLRKETAERISLSRLLSMHASPTSLLEEAGSIGLGVKDSTPYFFYRIIPYSCVRSPSIDRSIIRANFRTDLE